MEYKFRGKRKDNGKWVYGCYVSTNPGEAFILIGVTGHIKRDDYECYMVEVIPETVGMWTGLKDFNDAEIWTDDIYNPISGKGHYKVMFVSGAFVGGKSEKSCMPIGWELETENVKPDIIEAHCGWLEVIGNIHDNPELLNPLKGERTHTMNNFDPNAPQQPANQEAIQEQVAAATEQAQESAGEAVATEATTESAEEGGIEG